ncbi:MAG: SufD family Fe-S cluster assembly protein [Candidatus Micrarchaeota archaeon]
MNDVESISKDLNEPAWLLSIRQGARKLAKEPAAIPALKKPEATNPKNTRAFTLSEMLQKDAKFAKNAFASRKIVPEASPQAAYLNAYFRDCSFIFVDDNKKAELGMSLGGSLSINFIFLGNNSSLKIYGSAVSDCLDICEMTTGENSRIDCAFLKQKNAYAYRGLSATLGTRSSLCSASFWSGSGHGDTSVMLRGEGSKVLDVELSIGGNSENLSLRSDFTHSANNAESEVIMRGVAQDTSSTAYYGRVTVEGNGRGSKSELSQHVLLLDKGAKAEANPVMEIKNKDVECSHAASVRQLEEDKLFYLMSRGLPRQQAKTTMVTGFLRGAINRIEDKDLRNMFRPSFLRE